jgi:2-dehydro-3-deoxyphosphogluconate aldolase/(4S)-4-hydroxy-2-oxoglutarate aldolase
MTGPVFPFRSRVLPVVVLTDPAQAVPLAHALLEGGIDVMEITLRHTAGLAGIEAVADTVPQMHVGAGTITTRGEITRVCDAGARFGVSPGLTAELHQAARDAGLPFMPGVMTPSEVMQALQWGYGTVKLFPASQAGGLSMVKALAGPLGHVRLCPTGGVSPENLNDYLSQPNVAMVGGSWLTPVDLIETAQWSAITRLATEASAIDRALRSGDF